MAAASILIAVPRPQPLPDAMRDLQEFRRLPNVERALLRKRRDDDVGHAAGPRRHHHDLGREIDRLGDGVRDEADRLTRALPELEELLVQMIADDLVESPERL